MGNTTSYHQTNLEQDTLEIYQIAYGINEVYKTITDYENELACAYDYCQNTLQDIQNSIIL